MGHCGARSEEFLRKKEAPSSSPRGGRILGGTNALFAKKLKIKCLLCVYE